MYTDRQNAIIKYLAEVKFAKIEQLAEVYEVSIETIRRDLLDLERDAVIKRIRGGAVFNALRAKEIEFSKKLENHQLEKLAIAKAVLDHIRDGDAVAISNGSTNIALARLLSEHKQNLTIITNSYSIATSVNENPSHNVLLTGGHVRKHNGSIIGSMCIESLDHLRVDKAIVNIDGLSIEDGVMEYNLEEAAVIRKILEIAHMKIVLAEHRKFSVTALAHVCAARELDMVVTDWNISAKEVKEWADLGVRVISASRG